MGQDNLDEFRTKIREQLQKEAEQEIRDTVAKILETTNYDDETIAKRVEMEIHQVHQLRNNYVKWLYAKNLEITTEPQYISDGLPSQCLPF